MLHDFWDASGSSVKLPLPKLGGNKDTAQLVRTHDNHRYSPRDTFLICTKMIPKWALSYLGLSFKLF